ncbi:MAG: hypothetical protein ACR2G5_13180 [Pyrinomonadaceae bacterium]
MLLALGLSGSMAMRHRRR